MGSPVSEGNAASTRAGGFALFAAVFGCVFVVPVLPLDWHALAYRVLYTSIFLMATLSLERRPKKLLALAVFLALLVLVAGALDAPVLSTVSLLVNVAFFIFVVGGLILQIARTKVVSSRVILAAVNGYLLLGLAASIAVSIVVTATPGAIEFPATDLDPASRGSDYFYFGFVSLTTMGYGDVLPRSPGAKSLAILTGVTGQLYIAIIIAMLVGKVSSARD